MAHDVKLNLAQRLLKVCEEVGYVQKNVEAGAGSRVKGVARDEVVAQVRPVLLKHGVLAITSQINGREVATTQKSAGGTPLSIYVGLYATKFVNVDDPKNDFEIVQHEAQGNDYGDKAPGKAATYAEKLNLVKGLMLETGLDDEGRNPGEGDEPPIPEDAKRSGKAPIKQPEAKAGGTEKAPDTTPASPALVKQIKAVAESKGKTAAVEEMMKKHGVTYATLTKAQGAALWTKLHPKAEPATEPEDGGREPGQEG